MLSANASMYSIIPSISGSCTSLFFFRSSASIFIPLLCTTAPWLHRVPQSVLAVWIQLTVEPFQLVVVFFESSLIFHCHVVYSPYLNSLFCHIIPVTVFCVTFLHSILCELYVNRLHTIFFNKFLLLCLFAIFLSIFTAGQKNSRFLFPQSFRFFCVLFHADRAPQGSPAWSSHSAPSPFLLRSIYAMESSTFPQSADGSS